MYQECIRPRYRDSMGIHICGRFFEMRAQCLMVLLGIRPPLYNAWVLYTPYERAQNNEGYVLDGEGMVWSRENTFDLAKVTFFWSRPQDAYGTNGLGGGITWAMHPDFCDEIMSSFREESFLFGAIRFMTCDSLRNAIDASLKTWSSNHKHIAFKDVTDTCRHDTIDSDGYCVGAKVTISTQEMEGPTHDLAAFVLVDVLTLDRTPYTTAGRRVQDGLGLERAHLKLSTSLCWYLDTTFCAAFHKLGSMFGFDVRNLISLCALCVFIIASAFTARIMLRAVLAGCGYMSVSHALGQIRGKTSRAHERALAERRTKNSTKRCALLIDYLARVNLLGLLFCLFWMMFAPIFYTTVYLPCQECHGFSSTMAHEAGHLLGFSHPDTLGNLNLHTRSINYTNMSTQPCLDAMAHVQHANIENLGDTIMRSVAGHRPTTCLTEDDLDGLNTLYPTCDDDAFEIPVCTEPMRLTGYLRLLIAVMLPYSCVTLLVICVQNGIRSLQRRSVTRLRANVRRRSQQAMWLRASVRATWANVPASNTTKPKRPGLLERSFTRRQIQGKGGEHMVKALFGATMRNLHQKGHRTRSTQRTSTPPRGGAGNPPNAQAQQMDRLLPARSNGFEQARQITRPPAPAQPPPPTNPNAKRTPKTDTYTSDELWA